LEKAKQAGIVKEDIALSDDQIFSFIFHAGFSTADKITNVSGRGVGMDVVKKTMEKLRGKIKVTSEQSKGTLFSLQLPMTTSIIEGLVFRIGETKFIAPLLSVRQTVTPKKDELQSIHDREGQCFLYQGKLLPILKLYEYFQIEPNFKDPSKAMIIIVGNGQGYFGLMVDELLHKQQVVIKNIKDRFNDLKGISGGTILGSGQVGFILDPEEIVQQMEK
jgi:two-component system chemotaxis sensor kinase CheA